MPESKHTPCMAAIPGTQNSCTRDRGHGGAHRCNAGDVDARAAGRSTEPEAFEPYLAGSNANEIKIITGQNASVTVSAREAAASPELLEACNNAVQIIEQLIPEESARGVADVVLHQLRAAIAKATGEAK